MRFILMVLVLTVTQANATADTIRTISLNLDNPQVQVQSYAGNVSIQVLGQFLFPTFANITAMSVAFSADWGGAVFGDGRSNETMIGNVGSSWAIGITNPRNFYGYAFSTNG
jgi:hypothetical protein